MSHSHPIRHNPETGEVIEEVNPHRTSIAKVQAMLARKYKTTVPDDDPMLMMVTIYNALMDDTEASQKVLLAEIVKDFKESLVKELQPITEEALQGQIEGHMAKMRVTGSVIERLMHSFKRYSFWFYVCGIFTSIVSLVNIYLTTQ